jgi:uncharacterized protein YjdB
MKKFNVIVLSLLLIFCNNSVCHASQNTSEISSDQTAEVVESNQTTEASSITTTEESNQTTDESNQTTEAVDNNQTTVNANEIDLGDYQSSMVVGDKQLLTITVLPTDTTNPTVTYQSSNEGVATINGMGRITAVSAGTAQITVSCGSVQNSFSLEVKQSNDVVVTDIEIGNYESEMEVGKTQTLPAYVLPSNATNTTLTYTSSDSKIAKVLSTGEVIANAKGTATITVSAGSISKNVQITVNEVQTVTATEIDLGDYQTSMVVGDKQLLSATVLPTTTTEQTLTYQSSNEKVATINELGRITAESVGKAKITVKCGAIENSFQLTVKKTNDIAVTDIEIGNYEEEMEVDNTQTISATVKPSNATDTTISYASSDTSVATVLSSGEVKGIGSGTVTITVKAVDISKNIQITVKVATAKIEVNNTYVVLKPDEEFQLKASVQPSNATQSMTYKSADKDIASVSSNGTITAKSIGTTSILVSNGDLSTAVTVIVNKSGVADKAVTETENVTASSDSIENLSEQESELIEKIKNENNTEIEINAKDYPIISKNILKTLYETGKTIHIISDEYTLTIKGTDIVNYENEFNTVITFEKEEGKLTFLINEGKNLPGLVSLKLTEGSYNYLYLYNEAKDKYQRLKAKDFENINLDVTGKYLLTQDKINTVSISVIVIILVVFIILGLVIAYIAVKKQYWFW